MTSPLAALLRDQIRTQGPLSLADYMGQCLMHPQHGYYTTRDPFGAAGDFTTAPEMTQVFGELIGLWAVEVWRNLGSPNPFILCELGPGRGTLMSDALRAAKLVPEFGAALQLYLLESSPLLQAKQAEKLAAHTPHWITRAEDLPDLPVIFIANEFFDALPVHQYIYQNNSWNERFVGLDNTGQLELQLHPTENGPPFEGFDGMVVEQSPVVVEFANAIARKVVHNRGAALILDYGDDEAVGETVQAIAHHRATSLVAAPGEADITAHVSFDPLRTAVRKIGTKTHGVIELADFLLALGLAERTAQLCEKADEAQQRSLKAALTRLTDKGKPHGMGTLFKAFAFVNRDGVTPPGF